MTRRTSSSWAFTGSQPRPRRSGRRKADRLRKSERIDRPMAGYWTFTATSSPDFRVARCTWPSDAAAKARGSNVAKASSGSRPSSFRTCSRSRAKCIGGASKCSRSSVSTIWSGTMSGRLASAWPSFIAAPRR